MQVTPDGSHVLYLGDRGDGGGSVFIKRADGVGAAVHSFPSRIGFGQALESPDGKWMYLSTSGRQIRRYAVNPDGTLGAFTVFTEGVGAGPRKLVGGGKHQLTHALQVVVLQALNVVCERVCVH